MDFAVHGWALRRGESGQKEPFLSGTSSCQTSDRQKHKNRWVKLKLAKSTVRVCPRSRFVRGCPGVPGLLLRCPQIFHLRCKKKHRRHCRKNSHRHPRPSARRKACLGFSLDGRSAYLTEQGECMAGVQRSRWPGIHWAGWDHDPIRGEWCRDHDPGCFATSTSEFCAPVASRLNVNSELDVGFLPRFE